MQQRSVLLSLLLILLPVALFAQNDSTPKFFLGYSNLQAEGLPNKNNPNNVLSPEFIDRRSTLHGFNVEATLPIRNFGITGDFSFNNAGKSVDVTSLSTQKKISQDTLCLRS